MLAEKSSNVFVSAENLTVKKQNQIILDDINLSFADQAITVLLGSNGAGKSSLLRVLSGIKQGMSGAINWGEKAKAIRQNRLAYVSEPAVFYSHLTVEEQLLFHAKSHELLPHNAKQALADWQLESVANKRTNHLSLGYRQRLALAQAFMLRPRLLLLDEPMNGMDPELMETFKNHMLNTKKHACVVMASHLLHLMDDWVDEVVVMAAGRVVSHEKNDGDRNLYQMYQNSMEQYNHGTNKGAVS